MKLTPLNGGEYETAHSAEIDTVVAQCLASAADGDINALFDLGVVFSTGSNGVVSDLIEAHKWFNIAASRGHEEAGWCRADVSDEMTAREIAEAQRRARQWLAEERYKAA
ncbi:sel1 repeat family protein [Erythrobacter insulae]|uniref:Sel1 repeat family protein n=1 Tax=Erythrobacter insulae TaxID=2584124 RepID=A0A547PBV5_9SPHN|nr:sel1 repeat family protein [Erythrobacter insulae]TRD11524.1 sel1 repeat family protein [Erythrobacter insulae]